MTASTFPPNSDRTSNSPSTSTSTTCQYLSSGLTIRLSNYFIDCDQSCAINMDAPHLGKDFNPVRLKPADKRAATAVLARAFVEDPLLRYVCPDDRKRYARTQYIIKTIVSFGLHYGEVWTTPGHVDAAAIWMPPGTDYMTTARRIRTGMIFERLVLGRAGIDRYTVFNELTSKLHHSLISRPHWHLFVIGVDPLRQGHNVGSGLIKHMLERTDRDHVPVFLTAPNPLVVPFYERLGFQVAREVSVPNSSLVIRGMIRPPGD
jgi:GNAT superfamily N-acetyltransferase